MRRTKDRHCGRWNGHTKKHMKLLLRRRINGMFWSIGVCASRYNLSEWLPRQRSFDTGAEMIWTLFFAGPLTTPRLHKRFQFARVSETQKKKKKTRFPFVHNVYGKHNLFFLKYSQLCCLLFTLFSSAVTRICCTIFNFLPTFAIKENETGKSSQIRWNWLLDDF